MESVSFNEVGADWTYLVYVGEYRDKNKLQQGDITETGARLDMYIREAQSQPFTFTIPFKKEVVGRYWAVMCIGKGGAIKELNIIMEQKPDVVQLCQS